MKQPRTLMEAVRYFSDPDRTLEMAVSFRWPEGIHCPTCGRTDVRFLATRRLWECKEKHPKKQFSAKVGTIFEDSPLPLDKWFVAIWAVANCKNGISSYELARAVGVTQKSAWFMLHRIRVAMGADGGDKFGGIVESDETYIGGLAKNMHAKKRKARVTRGAMADDKAGIMGILQRADGEVPSRVFARVIKHANRKTVQALIRERVEPGSQLMTDGLLAYRSLKSDYIHQYVDHATHYARGAVHSNGIENFWSLLKRSIKGTYVSVDPTHVQRYVEEQVFRFNERKNDDLGRFQGVLGSVNGKRLADGDSDLQQRIARAEQFLRSKVTIKLTQNQFDGLVSFALSAPEAFDGPFLAAVNRGDFESATTLMLAYDKVRDPQSGRAVVDPALHARREAERNIILHSVYDRPQDIAGRSQDEPWSYRCDGEVCSIASNILNDDAPSMAAMHLDVIVGRKTKSLNEVRFTLPADTRGKILAFAFANGRTDAAGAPHIDLVSGSTRTIIIADCGPKECRIALPKGLLSATKDRQAMDVGAQIRANSQMLINYPSGKDYYRTSVLLSGLQARERQLTSGSPLP